MRGAIREDDYTNWFIDNPEGTCWRVDAPNPQHDLYPDPPDRVKNHFYDPVENIPLTLLGFEQGQRAPDWALGSRGKSFNSAHPREPQCLLGDHV